MKEEEVIRWLKAQGAIPTPPEIKARLKKSGYVGISVEEVNPFGD